MNKTIRLLIASTALMGFARVLLADNYLLTPRLTSNPGYQHYPSPSDWRDVNMYQLFTDRFSDGNTANNNVRGWYTTTGYRHYAMGGDWKGVRNKLDYLQGMGVNAIWLSGVQINEQGSDQNYAPYHAYHPTDFYRVEPMFGTFQELKELIDDAHSRGIYIILDVVINHMADLNGLGDGKDNNYYWNGGGNLFWWNGSKKHAWPLDNLNYFHNNGKILNYEDGGQILNGAFVGTDDLKTEDAFVQGHLVAAFKNLMESTDCDGFRVDAIKHVERPFLMSWADTMRNHAATLGKNNFILFGENFDYDDADVADHVKDPGAFNSALYFPMQQTMQDVFNNEYGTQMITQRRNNLHLYGEGQNNLVTFIDNHDVNRFSLYNGGVWEAKLKPALTFLYTGTPVPCLFYGTEHGFNQGGQPNNGTADGDYQRECMMNYGYQPGNANGDKFFASGAYNHIAALNSFRRDYPCLTRGNFTTRWEEGSKGLYAYTRALNDQEALVVFNTDWTTKGANISVGKPNGTTYINLFSPADTLTVSGGKLNVSVPSKGSKIYMAANLNSSVATLCTRSAITISYKPNKGPLEIPVSNIVVSIRNDSSVNASEFVMTKSGDTYNHTYALTNSTNSITFWFRDQKVPPVFDNNSGSNWVVTTKDCWKTGVNLQFVGNITTWPISGELDPAEDLWVDIETWPKNAAFEGEVVYSADGATWFSVETNPNGETTANSKWHANLGQFPRNANVQFAVKMVGENGDVWNSNNGSNYWIHVNTSVVPVNWIGNTYHWPNNGDIDSLDDLWINIESRPIGAAFTGSVVYSYDNGTNWSVVGLKGNGSTTNSDMWHVNLGKFPADSNVQYAVMLADEDGVETWDNNGGANFSAIINEAASSLQWFGATRNFSAPKPQLLMNREDTGMQMVMTDVRRDVTYSIFRSTDLKDWSLIDQVVGWVQVHVQLLPESNTSDLPYFYYARVDYGVPRMISANEEAIVSIETFPIGGAHEANVVYSSDNGSTWQTKPMTLTGQSGDHDVWSGHMGTYPAGTVIKYAVEIKDDQAISLWDNNSANDYSTTVVP